MKTRIRPIQPDDVETCGKIIYTAFKNIADRHHFRPDFPSPEIAIQLAEAFASSPQVFGVVAESDGQVIGSNFLWEYDAIRAVGPITVDPDRQAAGTGRRLMEAVIERGQGSEGIRLVQDSFNAASLSLYASLGFDVREPLVVIEGEIEEELPAEVEVRPLREEDLEGCAVLCRRAHGFERTNEIQATPPFLTSFVALRDKRVTAYATAPHSWVLNHAVAETPADLQSLLIGASRAHHGAPLSFLLPTRQSELFRWCLTKGLRVIKPMTLMTMGRYQEPRSCYLPSVGY